MVDLPKTPSKEKIHTVSPQSYQVSIASQLRVRTFKTLLLHAGMAAHSVGEEELKTDWSHFFFLAVFQGTLSFPILTLAHS